MAYVLLFVITKSLFTYAVIVSNSSPVVLLLPTELDSDSKARIWTNVMVMLSKHPVYQPAKLLRKWQ